MPARTMTKRRHHYLPQFYLRNFIDSAGRIWAYPKLGGKAKRASPRDLGVEKDYHTFTRKDGIKDRATIEEAFADIENEAAPTVRKIIGKEPLSTAEYEIFVTFVGTMLVRVPARCDQVGRMAAKMMKVIATTSASNKNAFHAEYQRFEAGTGHRGADAEEIRQFVLSDKYEMRTNPKIALAFSLQTLHTVTNCLAQMDWIFLQRTGRFQFLSCDNPVFYCDPTLPPTTWRGIGLMNRGIEVSVPLSPNVLAFGSYHSKERKSMQIEPEVVRIFNQRTIDSAYRYVFASEASEKIQAFISRNNDAIAPVEPYVR